MSKRVELVLDAKANLGEGPNWDADNQLLLWVNIQHNELHIFDPNTGKNQTINVGQQIGAAVRCKSGGLMLALQHGFSHLDTATEALTPVHDPEADCPANRFNDGKCDPAGRFWAGTMPLSGHSPTGSLYCMDTDRTVRRVLDKVTVSNGLAWSSDMAAMYYIDTPTREVAAFDYNPETGAISNRRVAVSIPEESGYPDGMTIDAEGMLWIALWEGSAVSRWDPRTGRHLESIEIPASLVTSCTFGGPDLDELYITTARRELEEKALARQPTAGGLFRAKPGVKGTEDYAFNG